MEVRWGIVVGMIIDMSEEVDEPLRLSWSALGPGGCFLRHRGQTWCCGFLVV